MNSTPKIYLFLSVDVIDSTKIKYTANPDINWVSEISNFYRTLPEDISNEIDGLKQTYQLTNQEELKIWKYSGDEILFYVNISEENQIPSIIEALATTLENLGNDNKKKIKFKGTAWVGQVPFVDYEFSRNKLTDFIGPSIDCGFRLGKYASNTHLILSLEIAYLCAQCNRFKLDIIYLKRDNLKGVLGDFKYPIFAIKLGIEHPEKDLTQNCVESILTEYIEKLQDDLELKKIDKKINLINPNIKKYLETKKEESKNISESIKHIDLFTAEITDEIDTQNGDTNIFDDLSKNIDNLPST